MTLRIGTDVSRRARKYRARQFVSDYEVASKQRELPLPGGGKFRTLREELDAISRDQIRSWARDFLRDD